VALQALQLFDDAKRPVPVEDGRIARRQHVDPMPQILQIGRIKDIPHRRHSSDGPIRSLWRLLTRAFRHFVRRNLAVRMHGGYPCHVEADFSAADGAYRPPLVDGEAIAQKDALGRPQDPPRRFTRPGTPIFSQALPYPPSCQTSTRWRAHTIGELPPLHSPPYSDTPRSPMPSG
jgi:hypothetical protein